MGVLFLILMLLFGLYLALPLVLFRISVVRYGASRSFIGTALPVAGIFMGLYCYAGYFLAGRLLNLEDNLLAYYGQLYSPGILLAGVISGVVLQIGMRFKTRTDKVLLLCGLLILGLVACFVGYLVVIPE